MWNHHDFEESEIFPAMQKASGSVRGPGETPALRPQTSLEKNIEEHHAFSTPLEATWLYLSRCRAGLVPAPSACPVPTPPDRIQSIDLKPFGLDQPDFSADAFRRHLDSSVELPWYSWS